MVYNWEVATLAERLGGEAELSADKTLVFWTDQGVVKSLEETRHRLLEIAENRLEGPQVIT